MVAGFEPTLRWFWRPTPGSTLGTPSFVAVDIGLEPMQAFTYLRLASGCLTLQPVYLLFNLTSVLLFCCYFLSVSDTAPSFR